MLSEVFGRKDGTYRKENYFWKCSGIKDLIQEREEVSKEIFLKITERISSKYDKLSEEYQSKKSENSIPLN